MNETVSKAEHDVLQSFYNLVVKERDYERHMVDKYKAENLELKKALSDILDVYESSSELDVARVQSIAQKALLNGR